MRHVAYTLAQCIWGLPQTLAGAGVFLAHIGKPRFRFHGAIGTFWGRKSDMSLGLFLFMEGDECDYAILGGEPADAAKGPTIYDRLLVHEYGHTIQSLILGPLYLPLIGLPSVIWLNSPRMKARRRKRKGSSYYAFWPERSANCLGERVLKLPSMGQATID